MASEATYDERLTQLEAHAYRTGRSLAEHGQKLQEIKQAQATAFSDIDSLGDAIGAPGDRSIAQRLDAMEQEIGAARQEATSSAC